MTGGEGRGGEREGAGASLRTRRALCSTLALRAARRAPRAASLTLAHVAREGPVLEAEAVLDVAEEVVDDVHVRVHPGAALRVGARRVDHGHGAVPQLVGRREDPVRRGGEQARGGKRVSKRRRRGADTRSVRGGCACAIAHARASTRACSCSRTPAPALPLWRARHAPHAAAELAARAVVAALGREGGGEVGLEHHVVDVAQHEHVRVDEEDLAELRHVEDAQLRAGSRAGGRVRERVSEAEGTGQARTRVHARTPRLRALLSPC